MDKQTYFTLHLQTALSLLCTMRWTPVKCHKWLVVKICFSFFLAHPIKQQVKVESGKGEKKPDFV